MKKSFIACTIVCLMGFLIVFPGCDQPAKKAARPKIVRKKIQAPPAQKSSAPSTRAVASTKPSPRPETAAEQSVTGARTPSQASIAQKSEPAAEKASKPKPPVEPKSDISLIRPAGTPKPAVKPGSESKAIASASPEVAAKSSSKIPPPYNPKGKIDPFEPLFKETPEVAVAKKERKKRAPRTPLERIDISQLKLVGIILAKSGNRALVEEASGKGYVIKKGTYLGTNAGKVVKIEKDKVIVAEEYEDVLGNVTTKNTEIKLPKPPGEL
ncbi:MAG: pilus assembly protein PilP [Desulfobacterales bacterium]